MKFERLEGIAWQAYAEGRKAPLTRPAGPGYADPAYALSVEWLAIWQAIDPAQLARGQPHHAVACFPGVRQRPQRRHLPR